MLRTRGPVATPGADDGVQAGVAAAVGPRRHPRGPSQVDGDRGQGGVRVVEHVPRERGLGQHDQHGALSGRVVEGREAALHVPVDVGEAGLELGDGDAHPRRIGSRRRRPASLSLRAVGPAAA